MDADMQRLEKLNEQRGISRKTKPDANAGNRTGSPGWAANEDRSGGGAIPSQSLLNAPSVRLDEPAPQASSTASGANGQAKPETVESSRGSWSTGVETAPAPSIESWQAEPQTPPRSSSDFEAQIREVLRSQNNEQQPAYRR
jgi:hypothetical protein